MKLLENSGVLLDGVTKTTKHEIKRKEDRLLLLLGTYFNDRKHVSCKESWELGKESWGYNMDFKFGSIFEVISRLLRVLIMNLGLMVFFQDRIYWQNYNSVLWFFGDWIYSPRCIKQDQS